MNLYEMMLQQMSKAPAHYKGGDPVVDHAREMQVTPARSPFEDKYNAVMQMPDGPEREQVIEALKQEIRNSIEIKQKELPRGVQENLV